MKSSSILFAVMLASPAAFADTLTPSELYKHVAPILATQPSIPEIELCVNEICETYANVQAEPRKGGQAQIVYQRPVSTGDQAGFISSLGDAIGELGGKVGAGGRVVFDWEKKNPDGSSEKVHIEASVGVGSAAAPAASAPAAPATNPHKSDLN